VSKWEAEPGLDPEPPKGVDTTHDEEEPEDVEEYEDPPLGKDEEEPSDEDPESEVAEDE
jgi:hypothetical protein